MAQSPYFRKLDRRLNELRRHLLPKYYSPTGDYTNRQLDRTLAYRLLCHAEIEQYVEDSSWSLVEKKLGTAITSGRTSLTILTLIAYHRAGWDGLLDEDVLGPEKKSEPRNLFKEPLTTLLKESVGSYRVQMVNNNNGIRTENLHRLLRPIGIDFNNVDSEWLTAMDEFGKLRGQTAHTSGVGVTHLVDPKTEADRIAMLFLGLKTLDHLLAILSKSDG